MEFRFEFAGAQSSLRRSDAVAGGHSDDESDHRDRRPAGHLRARPHHRRQERPRELEGAAVDITYCPLGAQFCRDALGHHDRRDVRRN